MSAYHARRSRVLTRLAHLHPDEYADLMVAERLVDGLPPEPGRHAEDVLLPCGTQAAYVRHLRHNEKPCDPCLAANAAKSREYRDTPSGPTGQQGAAQQTGEGR